MANYFSHDSNAKDDPKMIKLIDQLGLEGYGAFWVLIELLREQPNYRLPLAAVPRISRTYNITDTKLMVVIKSFQLFDNDEVYFFSPSLLIRMGKMTELYSGRTAKGWETRRLRADNQLLNDAQASQSIPEPLHSNAENANKSKVKEIKEKESMAGEPPNQPISAFDKRVRLFGETLKDYVPKYGRDMVKEFYNYWKEANKSRTKMRWEQERTWELDLRLTKWASNDFSKNKTEEKNIRRTIS